MDYQNIAPSTEESGLAGSELAGPLHRELSEREGTYTNEGAIHVISSPICHSRS